MFHQVWTIEIQQINLMDNAMPGGTKRLIEIGKKELKSFWCIIKYEQSWFCLDVINNDMHGGTKNLVEIGKNEFKSYWWNLHISSGYVVYVITVWKWDYDWEVRLGLGCEIMVGLCDNGWRVRIRFGGDLELGMIGITMKSVNTKAKWIY